MVFSFIKNNLLQSIELLKQNNLITESSILLPSRIMFFRKKTITSDKFIPNHLIGHLVGNPLICPDFLVLNNNEDIILILAPLQGTIWKKPQIDQVEVNSRITINKNIIEEIKLKKRVLVLQLYIRLISGEELFLNFKRKNKKQILNLIDNIKK